MGKFLADSVVLVRAEDALREGEEKFRQLAENVREVLFLIDHKNYNVLYVNSAYEAVWGRTRESLYEKATSWLDAVHRDDYERVYAALETQHITGVFNEIFRIIRPDRSVRWIHDIVYQIRNKAGEIYQLLGTADDITDRRHAEQAFRESEEHYRRLVELSPDGIVVVSDGMIVFANPAEAALRGASSPGEIIGNSATELLNPVDRSAVGWQV